MILFGDRGTRMPEFWAKVDMSGGPTACWPWLGTVHDRTGYGQLSLHGRTAMAHRVAYELTVAPIPPDLVIDHLCRVRDCVNPAHLEVVTVTENNRRSNGWGGINARKTHCPRGHELAGDNLAKYTPYRECRTCLLEHKRINMRKYRARAKAAKS